jgi:eukaryotic-like serine/threonine-protein kinase
MPLGLGTRLGPYEVVAAIGAGGMGEVYRAHDTKLNRDVALKILPATFASDPDRLARFHREAQVLASLNHPHIGAIYGVEDSGETHALVLELVEGPTLADRIAQSPIPIDEALPIATQIAEALEAAHEQGIIHRDLKPANIKLRPDGTVKVLDFGLAKLTDPGFGTRDSGFEGALSLSPTITSPALMTGVGVLLGTAAYMSPEQAKGRPADKRSDIWAFGCIVFEMLTGGRPFKGEDVTDTIAAVIRSDPEWTALRTDVPGSLQRLLRRCLNKDPRQRLRDIGDARLEVADALSQPDRGVPVRPASRGRTAAMSAITLLLGAALATVVAWNAMRQPAPSPVHLSMQAAGSAELSLSGTRDVAIAPDGQLIVYVGANDSKLFLRRLDEPDAKPLEALGVPHHPFFSPDGQWIAFFDGTSWLRKVALKGGPAVTVCRVGASPNGGAWVSDNRIVFTTALGVLFTVDASGGEPERLEMPDPQFGDTSPEPLPGKDAFLFTRLNRSRSGNDASVFVFDLQSRTSRVALRGAYDAHYVSTGHLVFAAGPTLRAAAFDIGTLQVTGPPTPVVDHVVRSSFGPAEFDIAANGTLAYVAGDVPAGIRTLAWVERDGHEEPLAAPARAYTYARVSPDGRRLALDVRDQENDIWIWDFARATLARFTFDPGFDQYPVWSPDGSQIYYDGSIGTKGGIIRQRVDGSTAPEPLTDSNNPQFTQSISGDGRMLVFREDREQTGQDLLVLMVTTRTSQPLMQTNAPERNGEVSPDGHWLAYESTESGQTEVYVRPMSVAAQGRWQISTGGGTRPAWARNGRELFYMSPAGAMMSAVVEPRSSFTAGRPTMLFSGRYYFGGGINAGRTYDVSPDGRRFLMIKEGSNDPNAAPPTINVVLNWLDELKRLVPAK